MTREWKPCQWKICCFAPLKWPTHGFDFTTPESLKVTTSDETKKNEKEDKRVKENRVALVWIFISSTLKNKTPWAG